MIENGNLPATMLVSPTGNYGGGFGGFGGDWGFLLLLLLCANGGWGMGGFGGWGGMMGMGMMDGFGLYPWLNNSQNINDGFRDQQLSTQVGNIQNSITSGFGDVQTALCSGFAGVNSSINNGFAQAEIAENSRQMANMNQMFGIQSSLQNCCCENRANIADLKYTVATENCADRTQSMQNTRDIIEANNRNSQAILDKLCALELDGVKGQLAQAQRENAGLQNQLNMASFRESQTAQNALIQQGFSNEVDQLYNRLSNCPVPSTPVYGRTPIFTCNGNNNGCGCQGFYN